MKTEFILQSRLANHNDVDQIVELVESAYRGESSRAGWTTEADFILGQRTDREEVSSLLEKENSVILLLEDQDVLLASVQLEKQGKNAYLGMFAVKPGCQGQGVGRFLLEAAEQFVSQNWQAEQLQMTVITIRQELISWYLRRGYQKSGVFKPFPYHEPRFGVPQRDDLELEVLTKSLIAFHC